MPAKIFYLTRREGWDEERPDLGRGDDADEEETDPAVCTPTGVRWEDVTVFGLGAEQRAAPAPRVRHRIPPALQALHNIFDHEELDVD